MVINTTQRTINIIMISVTVILVGIFIFVSIPDINRTKFVNLGESVRLEKDGKVRINGKNISVKISSFDNKTCPRGYCIGSGLAVKYELNVDGKQFTDSSKMEINESNPYHITTVVSDYNTYASIVVN